MSKNGSLPLQRLFLDRRLVPNRIHALLYTCGIGALLYHHWISVLKAPSLFSVFVRLAMILADLVLAFLWTMSQGFRWRPVHRCIYPENLKTILPVLDLPKLDVFICTADPHKEPPVNVLNTVLSVMAFNYPSEKLSVYVSDDGGSEVTHFALMQAAKFARYWLPFCREMKTEDRTPEAYLESNSHALPAEIKNLYERIKAEVEAALDGGRVIPTCDDDRVALEAWSSSFTRDDHPPVVMPLLQSNGTHDTAGQKMPNLFYMAREKRKSYRHHFKAGAVNALLRVSAVFSNAPIVLMLDCDMYSNDPNSALQAVSIFADPADGEDSSLAFVQFPQRYRSLNKHDIYACEHKWLFQINPLGMDGVGGPNFVGTGCFFRRRALCPTPIGQDDDVTVRSPLEVARELASCNHEVGTAWGQQMGLRYGSLVEDFFTGYRLHCEGWRSAFCNPTRPAFLGDSPINLEDAVAQNKRWSVGLLDVTFSRYSPLFFGSKRLPLIMTMCYAHYAHWPFWGIPIMIYGLIPQLALLLGVRIFPAGSDPWFYVYAYLFVGAYGTSLVEFLIHGGSIWRWWNDQRMWMIRGVSSHLFSFIQFSFRLVGLTGTGFNVTSKVVDEAQEKRYRQGMFEFGAASPLFVPLTTIALLSFISLTVGFARALQHGTFCQLLGHLILSGFLVVNSLPVYEAMVLRKDKGKLSFKTIQAAIFLGITLYILAFALSIF